MGGEEQISHQQELGWGRAGENWTEIRNNGKFLVFEECTLFHHMFQKLSAQ